MRCINKNQLKNISGMQATSMIANSPLMIFLVFGFWNNLAMARPKKIQKEVAGPWVNMAVMAVPRAEVRLSDKGRRNIPAVVMAMVQPLGFTN